MYLPADAEKLISLLLSAGYKAYAVGGCVRDSILGKPMSDVDICTSALPEETERLLEENSVRFVETGLKHGTITAVINHTPYEITTFRTDGEYLDNRRPESVSFVTDVKEDLSRRDFTVNALAYNKEEGIVDCFGGVEDIKNRVIRAVGNPDTRFNEDALRIMRALRFSSVLGFEIESETEKALFRNKELLLNIANERIYTELIKLLLGDNCENVLLKYREIIAVILPEIKPCFDFPQNNKWHIYDVYTHIVKTCAAAPKTDYIRLAAFLHDIGKPECKTTDKNGSDHFYRHPIVGAELAKGALKRLRGSNKVMNKTLSLIRYHDCNFSEKPAGIKKQLRKFGGELTFELIELKTADLKAHNPALAEPEIEALAEVKRKAQTIIDNKEPYRISDLKINGSDLKEIGFEGKEINKELENLILLVSGSPEHNEKEKLLQIAQKEYKRLKK